MKIAKIISGSKMINWLLKYNDMLLVITICIIIAGVWVSST